eukprot:157979_1
MCFSFSFFIILFIVNCLGNFYDLIELYDDDKTPENNLPLPIEVIPALEKIIYYKQKGKLWRDNKNMQKRAPFRNLGKKRRKEIIKPMSKQIKKAKRQKLFSKAMQLENQMNEKIKAFNKRYGVQQHFIDHRNTYQLEGSNIQYWMEYETDTKTLYIYIIGSESFRDYLATFNLDTVTIHYNSHPIIMHKGFYNTLQHVYVDRLIMDLHDILVDSKTPVEYIRLVGHSLGGAVAHLLLLSLMDSELMKNIYLSNNTYPAQNKFYVKILNELQAALPDIKQKYKYLAIAMGSPLFIYFKSVKYIDHAIQDRIINIITPYDPVVMLFGGRYDNDND